MNMTAIFIVAIVFGSLYAIIDSVLKHKKDKGIGRKSQEQLQHEIDSLKERVATLEKIVTDEKYQLNKEFENLK